MKRSARNINLHVRDTTSFLAYLRSMIETFMRFTQANRCDSWFRTTSRRSVAVYWWTISPIRLLRRASASAFLSSTGIRMRRIRPPISIAKFDDRSAIRRFAQFNQRARGLSSRTWNLTPCWPISTVYPHYLVTGSPGVRRPGAYEGTGGMGLHLSLTVPRGVCYAIVTLGAGHGSKEGKVRVGSQERL